MSFWVRLLQIVFPRLTKQDCQCVAEKLNVLDIERLTEALRIPTCDRQSLFLALYYGYIEVADELYEKGEKDVETACIEYMNYATTQEGGLYELNIFRGENPKGVRKWIANHGNPCCYLLLKQSWYDNILHDFTREPFPKPGSFVEDKYCQDMIKALGVDKILVNYDKAVLEIPFMIRLSYYPFPLSFLKYLSKLENKWGNIDVARYFVNNTYYNATEEDWKWIGQIVGVNINVLNYMISEESYPFALANRFSPPGFFPRRYGHLLDVNGTKLENTWTDEGIKMVSLPADPEFLARLDKVVDQLIRFEQETFIKVFPYLKTFKKIYLQLAYAHAHFEVIALLESKGLKLSKQCITNAIQFDNLNALDYSLRFHRDRMAKLYPDASVLFNYVTKVEAINWLVENFTIEPH